VGIGMAVGIAAGEGIAAGSKVGVGAIIGAGARSRVGWIMGVATGLGSGEGTNVSLEIVGPGEVEVNSETSVGPGKASGWETGGVTPLFLASVTASGIASGVFGTLQARSSPTKTG